MTVEGHGGGQIRALVQHLRDLVRLRTRIRRLRKRWRRTASLASRNPHGLPDDRVSRLLLMLPGHAAARAASLRHGVRLRTRVSRWRRKRQATAYLRRSQSQLAGRRSAARRAAKPTRGSRADSRATGSPDTAPAAPTPATGVAEWQDKWASSPGKRVLFLTKTDYSGSFYKWAAALNEHTDYAVRMVSFHEHQYGYQTDLRLDWPPNPRQFEQLFEECDVLHIKDETGFLDGSNRIPPKYLHEFHGPTIFTHYGGYARKHSDDPVYRQFTQTFSARVAMTPDLNYAWFDGHFVPHSVDVNALPYHWVDSTRIGHSPSTKGRKGTANFLRAIAPLRDSGRCTVDLIHGVSHSECLFRKVLCGVFFDQAGREMESRLGISTVIGWYGNSALEAAVHGIPTFAHMSAAALEGAARAGKPIADSVGILNIPTDVDGMRERLAWYLDLAHDERNDLSLRTRGWVEDFHSYQANARELAQIYSSLEVRR